MEKEYLRSIIFSNAFRRLKGKTQLITDLYNDNCRTRISHTTEVVNIAKDLASGITGASIDLVEIIAYSHDIGHTPFGHSGERAIHRIITGKNPHFKNFKKILEKYPEYKGFKHNLQGVRILLDSETILNKDTDLEGQILYGIAHHTGINYESNNKYDFELDLYYYNKYKKYLSKKYKTDESVIVAISDEIAQVVECIEDGFTLELIEPKDVYEIIEKYQFEYTSEILKEGLDYLLKILYNSDECNKKEILRKFTETLIKYFTKGMQDNFTLITEPDNAFFWCIKLYDELNNLFNSQLLQSAKIRHMDLLAENRIVEIFNYYYSNPYNLKDDTKKKFLKTLENLGLYSLGDIDYLFRLVNLLVTNKKNKIRFNEEKSVGQSSSSFDSNGRINDLILLEYIRLVINHISGMTDNYLINRLSELNEGMLYNEDKKYNRR